MGAEQSKRSKVCWNCYTVNGTQQCPSCNRYFHSECLTRSELAAKRTWICVVCNKLKESEQTDKETDLKTLPVLINGLLQKELFEEFENSLEKASPSESDAVRLLKNMLKTIKGRTNLPTYTSFDAFNVDVDWILDQYKAIFDEDETNEHIAELLKNVVNQEIDGLRKCSDCYANAHVHQDNWFTMVCNEPHIVAWAKFQGCNFWPVKIMSATGRKLSVRFFGDHTHADVAATKCYLFSEDSPAGKGAKTRGGLYQLACQEANEYIGNIKKKFGTFNHAPLKTAIVPEQLAQYTLQMIPGTGISPRSIDPNAMHNNDERAEVTSSSNDSGSTSGTGTSSSNSSLATTMDSSVNSQKSLGSPDPDPVDVEVQPAKKARLSTAAANNDECIPMDQENENNEDAVQKELTAGGSNEISLDQLEQVRNENVLHLGNQLEQKTSEIERLKHDNQALADENKHLQQLLEEKTAKINKAEAAQHKTPHGIDRMALVELAKKTKICSGCNAERPSDMLHFCDVSCQKIYLNQLKD